MTAMLAPGDVCGGNEVVRVLGTRGLAQLYEVKDRHGERRVLEVLDTDPEARPKLRTRLAQEGASLAQIDHAGVVRVFEAGADGERVFLLLQLVEGKSLREILQEKGGALPAEKAVRWVRQAAEGVADAHKYGIFHRDLKPEALLVTEDETVKVVDFGIGKLAGLGVRTSEEQQVATARYTAPERVRDEPATARGDVYALGLILYEALAGAHPIAPNPGSAAEIRALQLSQKPRPLLEAVPGLAQEVAATVDKAIAKDPAARFADMDAFVEALRKAETSLAEGPRAAAQPPPDASPAPVPAAKGGRRIAPTVPMDAVPPPTLPMGAMDLATTMDMVEEQRAKTEPLGPSRAAVTRQAAPARAAEKSGRGTLLVVAITAVGLAIATVGVLMMMGVLAWPP